MLRGGMKTSSSKPARKTAGDGAAGDRVIGAKNRVRDCTLPRQFPKAALSTLMQQIPALTAEDREMLAAAGAETPTVAQMQQSIALQLICVRRFLESGEMAAKDVIVALNKIGSQTAAAVQLATATTAATPSEIKITWGDGNRRTVPVTADQPVRAKRTADVVAGDLVECD